MKKILFILSLTMCFVSCTTDSTEEKKTYTVVTKLPSDDPSSKVEGSTRIECYHDGVLVNTTICHDDACIEWALNNCLN